MTFDQHGQLGWDALAESQPRRKICVAKDFIESIQSVLSAYAAGVPLNRLKKCPEAIPCEFCVITADRYLACMVQFLLNIPQRPSVVRCSKRVSLIMNIGLWNASGETCCTWRGDCRG